MLFSSVSLAEDGLAVLDCYVLDQEIATGKSLVRPAVVICPGGAYLKCAKRESEVVAARFLGMGFDAFVLRYHTYVTDPHSVPGGEPRVNELSHWPVQVIDLMRAMAYVRANANEWGIDSSLVYALGFSAGAHVVGSLAERFDDKPLLAQANADAEAVRPRAALLCYPMVDARLVHDALEAEREGRPGNIPASYLARGVFGKDAPTDEDYERLDLAAHVRPDMCPVFVWQTAEDDTLHAEDTLGFVASAMRAGVPCELHLFERGHHGMSLCDSTSAPDPSDVDDAAAAWVALARTWLQLDMAR